MTFQRTGCALTEKILKSESPPLPDCGPQAAGTPAQGVVRGAQLQLLTQSVPQQGVGQIWSHSKPHTLGLFTPQMQGYGCKFNMRRGLQSGNRYPAGDQGNSLGGARTFKLPPPLISSV